MLHETPWGLKGHTRDFVSTAVFIQNTEGFPRVAPQNN